MKLEELDKKLEWVFTVNNFPKRIKTSFGRFLFASGFHLFIDTWLVYTSISDGKINWLSYFFVIAFAISIFYEWRRQKNQT